MLIILIMNSTFSTFLHGLKKNFLYHKNFLEDSGSVLALYHWIYLCIFMLSVYTTRLIVVLGWYQMGQELIQSMDLNYQLQSNFVNY